MSAAYPTPPVSWPAPPAYRPPSAGTAESLVLVALVLLAIGSALPIIGIGALVGLAIFNPFPYIGWVILLVAVIGAVAIAFVYAAYEFSYRRIRSAQYEAAQAPTLVFGILSLFFGVVPGILCLIAYVKLGDAIRESRPNPWAVPPGGTYLPPPPAAPPAQLACRGCGRVYVAGQFAFCPQCGRSLTG